MPDEASETPVAKAKDESAQNAIGKELCIQYVGSQAGRCQANAEPSAEQIKAKQRRRQLRVAEPTEDRN